MTNVYTFKQQKRTGKNDVANLDVNGRKILKWRL